jgi:hypothetical protein|tara:strand:- start:625 stop:1065 length:441 start_codon:yes stop_codon:yes gene_type:complete
LRSVEVWLTLFVSLSANFPNFPKPFDNPGAILKGFAGILIDVAVWQTGRGHDIALLVAGFFGNDPGQGGALLRHRNIGFRGHRKGLVRVLAGPRGPLDNHGFAGGAGIDHDHVTAAFLLKAYAGTRGQLIGGQYAIALCATGGYRT